MAELLVAGNATAANVAAGKTFSSTTGYNQTGTLVAITPTGNATADDVLAGRTFSNASGVGKVGRIPVYSGTPVSAIYSSGDTGYIVAQPETGYYDESALIVSSDSNFIAANIKKDMSVFGVIGTFESTLRSETVTALYPCVSSDSKFNYFDVAITGLPFTSIANVSCKYTDVNVRYNATGLPIINLAVTDTMGGNQFKSRIQNAAGTSYVEASLHALIYAAGTLNFQFRFDSFGFTMQNAAGLVNNSFSIVISGI